MHAVFRGTDGGEETFMQRSEETRGRAATPWKPRFHATTTSLFLFTAVAEGQSVWLFVWGFFRGAGGGERGVWGRGPAFLASAAAGEKDVVQGTKDSAAKKKNKGAAGRRQKTTARKQLHFASVTHVNMYIFFFKKCFIKV